MNFLQNNFQTLYLGAAAGDIQGRISGASIRIDRYTRSSKSI
ncbi:hypothetical protein Q3F40_11075 [Enterococcus faecium]|nr:hypothetical protein [Enterococcus faecium]MDQ8470751.1 hypothetical protein [Enterococcus faecium]